jgi:hypothetical protein
MTTLDKIKLAIERGISCNPETGDVFGLTGKKLISKRDGYGVISISINQKIHQIQSHQFIYYWVHKEVVNCIDHINRDKYDNRITNLRSVTRQENQFNRGAKGYTYLKDRNKYQTQIMINRKKVTVGYYLTEKEARQAYLDAKKKYHKIIQK